MDRNHIDVLVRITPRWATIVGDMVGIPTVVMGYTFLAAGTSIPDAISSMVMAKLGEVSQVYETARGLDLMKERGRALERAIRGGGGGEAWARAGAEVRWRGMKAYKWALESWLSRPLESTGDIQVRTSTRSHTRAHLHACKLAINVSLRATTTVLGRHGRVVFYRFQRLRHSGRPPAAVDDLHRAQRHHCHRILTVPRGE